MKFKSITSRDNPLYKELKQLASNSQARRKSGKSLLDGVHLCQAYLQSIGVPSLAIASEASISYPEVSALLEQCDDHRGSQIVILPPALYAALSQVENGIDLLFVIDTPVQQVPETITRSAVLLDNLQDPGNLGSILRSAAAAGITEIFCGAGTAFAWSPKVLRAGMGAHFLLNIYEHVDLGALLNTCRIPVLATSSHATRNIYEAPLKGHVAWLFGHEGRGVSEKLLQRATLQVSIPHIGKIESLNVAASAAICLFEQVRQNRH